ncbi:hypothetical protein DGWBC_1606 [Dehalogenimonas sp. WBC-2]|nr:hypothetical protein DGWBC_1606 [Dehalogenimonas sp. WBC-2]
MPHQERQEATGDCKTLEKELRYHGNVASLGKSMPGMRSFSAQTSDY